MAIGSELVPSENVIFRPEEVHLTSSVWILAAPLGNWNVDMGNRAGRG